MTRGVPIRWKLILAIGIPLLVVYAVMLTVLIGQVRVRNTARLEQTVTEVVVDMAGRVEGRFATVARTAESLGAWLATTDTEASGALLASQLDTDPMIAGMHVAILGDTRFLRVRRGAPETLIDAADVPEWLASPSGKGWTEPYEQDGRIWVSFVVPVVSADREDRVVTVDVDAEALPAYFRELDIAGGELAVLSGQSRFVLNTGEQGVRIGKIDRLAEQAGRPDIAEVARRMTRGETGVVQAEGLLSEQRNWLAFAPIGDTGWSLVVVAPESLVTAFARSQLQLGIAILVAGLVVILGVVWLMASRITSPLARLARAVEKLGGGDLETSVAGVDSRDEIGELARAFDRMVADLRSHVAALTTETAAREAVESELRIARQIQTSLLPAEFPRRDELELHARNVPARQVAGDFFDFVFLDDDRLILVMADVSGKGVPAAMYMAVARTVLRQVAADSESLAEGIARANDILEANEIGSMYVTLFVALYRMSTGDLRYVNGGHPAPYVVRPTGEVRALGEATGPVVGILPGREYGERSTILEPGEGLVLFTDGVPEATSPAGDFFGDERFEALLSELADEPAERLCDRIVERIDAYQQGSPHDDVTVMALRRRS